MLDRFQPPVPFVGLDYALEVGVQHALLFLPQCRDLRLKPGHPRLAAALLPASLLLADDLLQKTVVGQPHGQ